MEVLNLGVYLKPNYYFDLSILSLGIALDIGYQRDVFAYKSDINKGNLTFDSLSVGLSLKLIYYSYLLV